jgi:hypothetical protein
MDTTKMKYLQAIGMHGMFLNVATFRVTNRSISSTKKEIDFLKHFYLNDYLTTYYYVVPRILGHPVDRGSMYHTMKNPLETTYLYKQ